MKRLTDNIYIGEISPMNHQYEWEYSMIYIDKLQDLIKGDVIQFLLTPGNKRAPSNSLESTTIALNDRVL